MAQFPGKSEFVDANGKVILTVDPDSSSVQIAYYSPVGSQITSLTNTGSLSLLGGLAKPGARLDGSIASLFLGGPGVGGKAHLSNGAGVRTVYLYSGEAEHLPVGVAGSQGGSLTLGNSAGQNTVYVDGGKADLFLGGANQDGSLTLRNSAGQNTVYVDGGKADLFLGGANQDGSLTLRNSVGADSLILSGGNEGSQGGLVVKNGNGNEIIRLDLIPGFEPESPGQLGLAVSEAGRIAVSNYDGKKTVILDGAHGDIILENADCAEDFDVAGASMVDPGTVVVMNDEGKLQSSEKPYDKKVVGVISGAGQFKPALVLDRKGSQPDRQPVALVGKVYCKVDAYYSPIEMGDLLTTSPTPGHAMKATDYLKAFGAVIGKALHPLKSGQGLIPILIALQ